MALQWKDKSTLMCHWTRSGAHAKPIPATHALTFGAEFNGSVACLPCAEFVTEYQRGLGTVVTVMPLADAPPIPAQCRWMWRSHGCYLQGGHEGTHRCDCDDEPTERDELWQDER